MSGLRMCLDGGATSPKKLAELVEATGATLRQAQGTPVETAEPFDKLGELRQATE